MRQPPRCTALFCSFEVDCYVLLQGGCAIRAGPAGIPPTSPSRLALARLLAYIVKEHVRQRLRHGNGACRRIGQARAKLWPRDPRPRRGNMSVPPPPSPTVLCLRSSGALRHLHFAQATAGQPPSIPPPPIRNWEAHSTHTWVCQPDAFVSGAANLTHVFRGQLAVQACALSLKKHLLARTTTPKWRG